MGIKGLMKLLDEEAHGSYRETELKTYFGRTIAIDASMQLYAFLISVRAAGDAGRTTQLTNAEGEITSHLQGFLTRAVRLLEAGLKPVFVFDGKAPTLKGGELAKRKEAKAQAEEQLKQAEEALESAQKEGASKEELDAAAAEANQMSKRTVRATREQNDDVKKLLRLMGIPIVEAPCEAEAQCAELAKKGKVWATATEDMDALTFATPILLRHLTQSEAKKVAVYEIHLEKVLGPEGLNLSLDQFIDLCILCGCDYCDSIKGIGPKTALKLIREHKSIEGVIKSLDRTKFQVPEMLESRIDEVRALFKEAEVTPAEEVDLSSKPPDREALVKFLVEEHSFNKDRVDKALERLFKARQSGSQMRLDSFFKVESSADGAAAFKKRPADDKKAKGVSKKGKR